MLPVVGIMFTFQPALVLIAIAGAMLTAGLIYMTEYFVWYRHEKRCPPKWHILLEGLLFFIFNLIFLQSVTETWLFKMEIIKSLTPAL